MGRIEKSIVIKATPEKVWEMLAFDRFPEWMKGWESVEYSSEVRTPEDKYQVGATALGTPEGGPVNNCHFDLIESLENEKFTHRMWEKDAHGTLGGLITCTLEPVKAGTRFTYVVETEIHWWGILGKILEPLMLWYARERVYKKALENLKSILEK